MNETEDVLNNKSNIQPKPESLPDTPIVMTLESGSVFMDKLPKKETKTHWAKTTLEVRGKRENLMVLESGKLGTLLIKWQTKDALTKNNLVKIAKNVSAGPWHVKWLETEDGTKFAVKILDESQYAAEQTARNRHRKMLKHGFATQNEWLS